MVGTAETCSIGDLLEPSASSTKEKSQVLPTSKVPLLQTRSSSSTSTTEVTGSSPLDQPAVISLSTTQDTQKPATQALEFPSQQYSLFKNLARGHTSHKLQIRTAFA